MMASLTQKQLQFCEKYVTSRDAKKSALEAGYSETYANGKAYLLLKDERVLEKIAELEKNFFSDRFAKLATASMDVLEEIILENYEDRTRLAAIKEVFRFYELEKKLGVDTEKEAVSNYNGVNIVFNEVASRKEEVPDE
jgi:phage terminase small subunit